MLSAGTERRLEYASMIDIERPSSNSARAVQEYPVSSEELLKAVRQAVEKLPRWSLGDYSDSGMEATRKTGFLRFTDDVVIKVESRGDKSRLEATSQSRVGRSDLGQNPRNLKELLGTVERSLEADLD